MPARIKSNQASPERTKLIVTKDEFRAQILQAIRRGEKLSEGSVEDHQMLDSLLSAYSFWDDYNSELLKSVFNNEKNDYKYNYDNCDYEVNEKQFTFGPDGPKSVVFRTIENRNKIHAKLTYLRQLLNKTNLIPSAVEPSVVADATIDSEDPLSRLHPKIRQASAKLFIDGHYRQALLDSCIVLTQEVKNKSDLDFDNTTLMQKTFSSSNPTLEISEHKDEQQGFMWLFSGMAMGLRNPNAHSIGEPKTQQETLEWLCFLSALFRALDKSKLK